MGAKVFLRSLLIAGEDRVSLRVAEAGLGHVAIEDLSVVIELLDVDHEEAFSLYILFKEHLEADRLLAEARNHEVIIWHGLWP